MQDTYFRPRERFGLVTPPGPLRPPPFLFVVEVGAEVLLLPPLLDGAGCPAGEGLPEQNSSFC